MEKGDFQTSCMYLIREKGVLIIVCRFLGQIYQHQSQKTSWEVFCGIISEKHFLSRCHEFHLHQTHTLLNLESIHDVLSIAM